MTQEELPRSMEEVRPKPVLSVSGAYRRGLQQVRTNSRNDQKTENLH